MLLFLAYLIVRLFVFQNVFLCTLVFTTFIKINCISQWGRQKINCVDGFEIDLPNLISLHVCPVFADLGKHPSFHYIVLGKSDLLKHVQKYIRNTKIVCTILKSLKVVPPLFFSMSWTLLSFLRNNSPAFLNKIQALLFFLLAVFCSVPSVVVQILMRQIHHFQCSTKDMIFRLCSFVSSIFFLWRTHCTPCWHAVFELIARTMCRHYTGFKKLFFASIIHRSVLNGLIPINRYIVFWKWSGTTTWPNLSEKSTSVQRKKEGLSKVWRIIAHDNLKKIIKINK